MLEAAWWGDGDRPPDYLDVVRPDKARRWSKDTEGRVGGAAEEAMAGARKGAGAGEKLSVLCRTREQAEAALAVPWLTEVVLDFLEVHGLQDAVRAVQASGRSAVVATPRVLKPDEEKLWRFYLKLGAGAYTRPLFGPT
jgi:putative protease